LAVHWALSLGGMPRSKTADALGPCATFNYNNPVPFAQNGCRQFSPRLFFLTFFLTFFFHEESWPPGTPFMIVSAQRFAPNQYGISR
jgi:hypothetical protein